MNDLASGQAVCKCTDKFYNVVVLLSNYVPVKPREAYERVFFVTRRWLNNLRIQLLGDLGKIHEIIADK